MVKKLLVVPVLDYLSPWKNGYLLCLYYLLSYCRFVDFLVFGDYPDIMKKRAGMRVPSFTKDESKQIKNSFDFIGINHYVTKYAKNSPKKLNMDNRDYDTDMAVAWHVCCLESSTKLVRDCFTVLSSSNMKQPNWYFLFNLVNLSPI